MPLTPLHPQFFWPAKLDRFDGHEILIVGQAHVWQSSAQFFQNDDQFKPGERRTEAKMAAEPKRNVTARILAVDIQNLAVVDVIFITIG
jgi:hypothetical protein